ncbi:MAG: dihydropteroate synthase, partial [Thermoplasmatota archaeon]
MFKTRVLTKFNQSEFKKMLNEMGVEPIGTNIMTPKSEYRLVYAEDLDPRAANIVKQEFLSAGGEVAVSWEALNLSEDQSRIIMMGTLAHYDRVCKKLKMQPFDLDVLAKEIQKSINYYDEPRELPWHPENCQVMGILNVTPDSFYDGGEFNAVDKAVERAVEMDKKGADIIDIGGESTRPGSERVSLEEEKERVLPVIEKASKKTDTLISIDTYKSEIAEAAVDAGADIVNDIFGLRKEGMAEKVAELDVPVIIMHMQGTPRNMQKNPRYDDVITDVSKFFLERVENAKNAGISEENIILDPGIGFGKDLEHNLEIIRRLDEFNSLGYPILLGASRKSFLKGVLDKE